MARVELDLHVAGLQPAKINRRAYRHLCAYGDRTRYFVLNGEDLHSIYLDRT